MQALWNSVLLCSRRGGHHDQIHHGTPRQTRHGRWLGPHGYLDSETHPEHERDHDPDPETHPEHGRDPDLETHPGHDPDPDPKYERDPEHDVP